MLLVTSIGVTSYALAAAAYLIFTILLVTGWRKRLQGGLLVLATSFTVLWAAVHALWAGWGLLPTGLVQMLEPLHLLVWFVFLFGVLRDAQGDKPSGGSGMRTFTAFIYVISALLLVLPFIAGGLWPEDQVIKSGFLGYVLLSVGGLFLVENLYRNTRPEQRWGIKFLCLGIGGIFAYEFYMYAQALLFRQLDISLWSARGAVYALVVPLMGVSVARNPQWSLSVFISRKFVFHTVTLLVAGCYLLLMAAAGYYIKVFGGEWGRVFQVVFLFGAAVVLLALLFSGQQRARLRVFLGKHFFRQHFDYREQWLNFTNALSRCSGDALPQECVVRCVAEVVESPGGILWLQDDNKRFMPVAHWGMSEPEGVTELTHGSLARFLEEREWVINLDEYRTDPEFYASLELPDWLEGLPHAWLVVPLMNQQQLIGFIVLAQPRAQQQFNWELRDLLKTVTCQAAGHLVQLQTLEALSESRQFEGFHRLATVVLHDIKNLIAQQTLVVSSAARHKHKPEFIDDAVEIMEHSVAKMRRLMELLHSGLPEGKPVQVNLVALIEQAVRNCSGNQPLPEYRDKLQQLTLLADRDRLTSVIENIVRNAQDATPRDGYVNIHSSQEEGMVTITVEDNGCGMDEAFIRDRLFRPFDTTKGDTGMGVGAYDSRAYIRALGGELSVTSAPGKGTVFRISLPVVSTVEQPEGMAGHVESVG
ncbi:MAG: PEP-CTERM system histidine kinase PrsK [Gammaproteobacteria bacterium]|nr:MAG: PEP-CTERM system histidine kinase PrsK [Gammaproteobacteria bacterium]